MLLGWSKTCSEWSYFLCRSCISSLESMRDVLVQIAVAIDDIEALNEVVVPEELAEASALHRVQNLLLLLSQSHRRVLVIWILHLAHVHQIHVDSHRLDWLAGLGRWVRNLLNFKGDLGLF